MLALRTILLLLTMMTASAQTVSESELTRLLSGYKGMQSFSAKFTQTKSLKDVGLELKSQGQLQAQRSSDGELQVDWEVVSPSYTKLRLEDRFVTLYRDAKDQTGKKLPLTHSQAQKWLQPLRAWLSMDAREILKYFDVQKLSAAEFRLTPKALQDNPLVAMEFSINAQRTMKAVTLFEHSGDRVHIEFADHKVKTTP